MIETLAITLALALIFGMAVTWLKLPTILGYLLAGIAAGPFTPGLVASTGIATELADIGIVLLLFGVGLHFSLPDLLSVKHIAVPGAMVQLTLSVAVTTGVTQLLGWPVSQGIVLGLCLSVSSTVVITRQLERLREGQSQTGRLTMAWAVVQDLFTVVALVVLPVIGSTADSGGPVHQPAVGAILPALLLALAKFVAFAVLTLSAGSKVLPWLLARVSKLGSQELFTLAVLAIAVGIAFLANAAFGVSLALGAFLAGLAVGESDLSQRAGENALPLRDAFAVLFFVSVGMLFQPSKVVDNLLAQGLALLVVVVATPLCLFLTARVLRQTTRTAALLAMSFSQIGEFSFIVGELGIRAGLLPEAAQNLIVTTSIVSITLNPFLFRFLPGGRDSSVRAQPV